MYPEGVTKVAKVLCKDGIVVSTVSFSGVIMTLIGEGETALATQDSGYEVVERYKTREDIFKGHAKYVKEHGGALKYL